MNHLVFLGIALFIALIIWCAFAVVGAKRNRVPDERRIFTNVMEWTWEYFDTYREVESLYDEFTEIHSQDSCGRDIACQITEKDEGKERIVSICFVPEDSPNIPDSIKQPGQLPTIVCAGANCRSEAEAAIKKILCLNDDSEVRNHLIGSDGPDIFYDPNPREFLDAEYK